MCRGKELFYRVLENVMERRAKAEVNPDNTIIMELIAQIAQLIKPSSCTIRTASLWPKVTALLERGMKTEDPALMKAYLEKVLEDVKKLVTREENWSARVLSVLVLLSALALLIRPLNAFNYIPWFSLILYALSPVAALAALFVGGLFTIPFNPLLGALYSFASVVVGFEPSLEVDTKVEVKMPRVSREEVERLFIEYYGEREGKELFKFELYQLIISGKTEEEALAELWERLTKISSGGGTRGGDHVGVGRKDEGTQNNN